MKEIIDFLDAFFKAERLLLIAYMQPDLQKYNKAVDNMSNFAIQILESGFGAKMKTLQDVSFYDRVKNYPPPDLRYLFRLDKYETSEKVEIYHCFVSNSNPGRRKRYLYSFVISRVEKELKIVSIFFFSNKGMDGDKKWYFNAGDTKFMHEIKGENLLNNESLGKRIEINRLLEPSDDKDSMKEYEKD